MKRPRLSKAVVMTPQRARALESISCAYDPRYHVTVALTEVGTVVQCKSKTATFQDRIFGDPLMYVLYAIDDLGIDSPFAEAIRAWREEQLQEMEALEKEALQKAKGEKSLCHTSLPSNSS